MTGSVSRSVFKSYKVFNLLNSTEKDKYFLKMVGFLSCSGISYHMSGKIITVIIEIKDYDNDYHNLVIYFNFISFRNRDH